jgi:transcriptional regulator with XRE-family HTH domain
MNKKVGQRIRMFRAMRGLSQDNVADELGMTTGNYGKMERGEITISVTTVAQISKILKVTIAELFDENPYNNLNDPLSAYVTRAEFKQLEKEVTAISKDLENGKNALRANVAKQRMCKARMLRSNECPLGECPSGECLRLVI